MESPGRSLFLFSSLITTSTHCYSAETRLALRRSSSQRGGFGRRSGRAQDEKEKQNKDYPSYSEQGRLPADPATRSFCCFPDCAEIAVKMSLRGFVVDGRGELETGCVCEILRWHGAH